MCKEREMLENRLIYRLKEAIDDMHPCDLQSSMLKGCLPSDEEQAAIEDRARRRNIRRIYLAMIAEFDAMVGLYVDSVREAGVADNTIFIVTSDHGDMQMERRQHYKMVPYDASASVPMVIMDGRRPRSASRIVTNATSLIDIYPTVMDLAAVAKKDRPTGLDGSSLLPFLSEDTAAENRLSESERTPFIVSQFHGCNIATSWFLVVQTVAGTPFKVRSFSKIGPLVLILFAMQYNVRTNVMTLPSLTAVSRPFSSLSGAMGPSTTRSFSTSIRIPRRRGMSSTSTA